MSRVCPGQRNHPESAHNPKVAGSNPAPATESPGQRLADEGFYRHLTLFYRRFHRLLYRLPASSLSKVLAASDCMPGRTCW